MIDVGDPHDPIARQFLPDGAELDRLPQERADPIGDHVHEAMPGLVHRYPDRVLLKLANSCPVYCRFCFRRETVGPGQPAQLSDQSLERALAYIAERPEIWEVVVTGGDPLILSPRRLAIVAARIAAVRHVKVLRWHTRVPLVAPERIDDAMIAALRPSGPTAWLALHANHPREFTAEGRGAIARLVDAGIPLVSQIGPAEGCQRRPRNAGGADARLCREPGEALLSCITAISRLARRICGPVCRKAAL